MAWPSNTDPIDNTGLNDNADLLTTARPNLKSLLDTFNVVLASITPSAIPWHSENDDVLVKTNVNNTFTMNNVFKTVNFTMVTATGSAVDWTAGLKQKITLGTSNTTLTFTPPPGTVNLVLIVFGSENLAGITGAQWIDGAMPTFTGKSMLTFLYDDGVFYGTGGSNYS